MRYDAGILIFAVVLATGSCTTVRYVPVPERHTDTVRVTTVRQDSIYVHDSVSISGRGDTVFVTKYRYTGRERLVRDTVYQSLRDSVSVPVNVNTESGVRRIFRSGIAVPLLAVALLFAVLFLKRR